MYPGKWPHSHCSHRCWSHSKWLQEQEQAQSQAQEQVQDFNTACAAVSVRWGRAPLVLSPLVPLQLMPTSGGHAQTRVLDGPEEDSCPKCGGPDCPCTNWSCIFAGASAGPASAGPASASAAPPTPTWTLGRGGPECTPGCSCIWGGLCMDRAASLARLPLAPIVKIQRWFRGVRSIYCHLVAPRRCGCTWCTSEWE
jgi:hypothetical protein